eukprot:586948-Rhodomonas_salina.1
MERGPDKEHANWGFGGGVFLLVEGQVKETVDLLFEGREQSVEVRTVQVGELFGETTMWGVRVRLGSASVFRTIMMMTDGGFALTRR